MSVRTLREGAGLQTAAGRDHPSLVCFSHLRWNFVFQRPQHILTRAARTFRVHFVEEPIFEACIKPYMRCCVVADGVSVAVPILPDTIPRAEHAKCVALLLDHYLETAAPSPAVGWYYTPMALEHSAHLTFPVQVYDCMDELSCFKDAPDNLRDLEQQLMAKSDIVFTGGVSLFEAKRELHDNVHVLPSSIDRAHFAPARTRMLAEPSDLAAIPHPRVGYFGVLDERLDLALVDAVAAARPDWQFVMLGPVAKIDPACLPSRPNIHWLGIKTYAELPAYLAHFDVGWMPFALNDATRYISPTKTPEFLAAGLPLASTKVTDVVRAYGAAGLVEIADGAEEMMRSLGSLLSQRDDQEFLARVDRHLASMSWDSTWARMLSEITRCAPESRNAKIATSATSSLGYA